MPDITLQHTAAQINTGVAAGIALSPNRTTLAKLGESEGGLTFNGSPIAGIGDVSLADVIARDTQTLNAANANAEALAEALTTAFESGDIQMLALAKQYTDQQIAALRTELTTLLNNTVTPYIRVVDTVPESLGENEIVAVITGNLPNG